MTSTKRICVIIFAFVITYSIISLFLIKNHANYIGEFCSACEFDLYSATTYTPRYRMFNSPAVAFDTSGEIFEYRNASFPSSYRSATCDYMYEPWNEVIYSIYYEYAFSSPYLNRTIVSTPTNENCEIVGYSNPSSSTRAYVDLYSGTTCLTEGSNSPTVNWDSVVIRFNLSKIADLIDEDLNETAAHELGHVFGLAHDYSNTGTLMYWTYLYRTTGVPTISEAAGAFHLLYHVGFNS